MNEDNINKKSINFKAIIIAVIILAVVLIVIFVFKSKRDNFINSDENASFSLDYETSAKANFYVADSDIYYSTKDGIQLLNSNGETKWSDTFTMVNPYIYDDGEIIAVADENGTNIRVYDKTGKLYDVTKDSSIITFAVNSSGYLVAVFKNNSDYELNVYNNAGEVISTGKYPFDDGMPIAVDISDDSRIYAVSFLDISDIKMQSKVLFYYARKDDAAKTESSDGMFASFIRGDEVVAKIKFMENNNIVAISDTEMVCVDLSENKVYEEKWTIPFLNRISNVEFLDNKYIAIGYGEKTITEQETYDENTLCLYDMSGSVLKSFKLNKKITGINTNRGMVVVGMDRYFEAFNTNSNKAIWTYSATQDVNKIISYDGGNKILFVTPSKMSIMNVNRGNTIENTTYSESEENTSKIEIETETEIQTETQKETQTQKEKETGETTTIIE